MNGFSNQSSRGWTAVIAAVAIAWGAWGGAQDVRDSGVLRWFTAGTEIGRERFLRTPHYLETETILPVLAVKLRSKTVYQGGRPVAYEATVFRLPHDSLLQIYSARLAVESVYVTHRAGSLVRSWSVAARVDAVAASQSLAVFADLALRASGRDTVFRLWSAEANGAFEVRVRHGADTVLLETDLVSVVARRGLAGQFDTLDVPAQRVRALRAPGVDLPPLPSLEPPKADYSAPPNAPYRAEEVRVPVILPGEEPFELGCTLTVPKLRGRYPAVVLIGGSGAQDRDENLWPLVPDYRPFREIADRLSRAGIAVLRCDDRGFGQSGGTRDSATMEDFALDVKAQLTWLEAHPRIDSQRMALVGHSEGGVVGPMVAADDRRVAAVVIMAGSAKPGLAVLRDQLIWPIETAPGLTPKRKQELKARALEQLERDTAGLSPWMRHFRSYNPLLVARRLRQPVLILHGGLDRQVTVGQADTLAAAIREGGNSDVTVRIFPRLNHLFLPSPSDGSPAEYATIENPRVPTEVLDSLTAWLVSRLGRNLPR